MPDRDMRMAIRLKLSTSAVLRRVVLPIFARINPGDITIRHHWTGDRLLLHSFRHRGYWFSGAARERETMLSFRRLIDQTSVVFDVGGHIGYTAIYFARLAPLGLVHVFEPSPTSLRYLRRNARGIPNITVAPVAVGASPGVSDLWEESLSGQNSSLLPELSSFRRTERHSYVRSDVVRVRVPVVRLDEYARRACLTPDFVKIDIEGFEYEALSGGIGLLTRARPKLMVEITRNTGKVAQLLSGLGYQPFDDELHPMERLSGRPRNTFFLHRDAHLRSIRGLLAT